MVVVLAEVLRQRVPGNPLIEGGTVWPPELLNTRLCSYLALIVSQKGGADGEEKEDHTAYDDINMASRAK